MKKGILWAGVVLLVIGVTTAFWLYNMPHRKANAEPFVTLKATELYKSFEANEAEANENYLDKVIEVHGIVSSVSINQQGDQVILMQSNDPMFGVSCTMDKSMQDVKPGQSLYLKGICKGYLSDVVLTDCIYIKH
ncbi:MAG TPA: hypothetical protein PLV21_07895 [Cyclobacteriaceae bacterium]|nr:hypothetical protein [Cyclobacteriaceae bacterium]HRJ81788.1 hypothetical protein [Cyclobacteriaceae bacterium]